MYNTEIHAPVPFAQHVPAQVFYFNEASILVVAVEHFIKCTDRQVAQIVCQQKKTVKKQQQYCRSEIRRGYPKNHGSLKQPWSGNAHRKRKSS